MLQHFNHTTRPEGICREKEGKMLETRSAYGYYGNAGGHAEESIIENSDVIYKKMKYFEYKNYYPDCKTLGDYSNDEKTITVIVPKESAKQKPMRWPKEFERVTAQKVRLRGTNVFIYQWNTGKKKNFMIEKIGLPVFEQNTWSIPGYGNEAMKLAIEKAKSLA